MGRRLLQGTHHGLIRVRCGWLILLFFLSISLIWSELGVLGRSLVPDNYGVPAVARLIDRVLKTLGPLLEFGFHGPRGQTTSHCSRLPRLLGLDIC